MQDNRHSSVSWSNKYLEHEAPTQWHGAAPPQAFCPDGFDEGQIWTILKCRQAGGSNDAVQLLLSLAHGFRMLDHCQ